MNPGPLLLLILAAGGLLAAPRRWAPLPFLMTACYLSIDQALEIGPFTFTALRILIAVGVARVVIKGERLVGGVNALDRWMVAWAIWACASGFFHEDPVGTFNNRLGLIYNTLGIYFLLRVFCTSLDDVIALTRATALLLLPVGIEMLYEMIGNPSLFYVFAGDPRDLYIRGERIRAMGPFAHPILAGTVGAVCLPLMAGLWQRHRRTAFIGIFACIAMVVSSASSGPLMSTLAALLGLAMWRYRLHMKAVRWLIVAMYVSLAIAMKAPVYYLIARINAVDGSTGYHRALLIESAIRYLNDWWLAGTDFTRHWAPSPGFSPAHTDITNQFISMGILGGLPLMFLFIGTLVKAYSMVGTRLREQRGDQAAHNQFVLWTLGCALFAHTITFISVSYFDQAFVFVYVALAAIGSANGPPAVDVSNHTAPVFRRRGRSHAASSDIAQTNQSSRQRTIPERTWSRT